MIKQPNFETFLISSMDELDELVNYVGDNQFSTVVLDTETDSSLAQVANLYGIALCFNSEFAFYIPIRKPDGSKFNQELEQATKNWLRYITSNLGVIGHNIVYDSIVLKKNWDLDIVPNIHTDTILLKHMLDEEPPHGLKESAVKYLGPWADKAQQALLENIKKNGGSTTKDNLQMCKADTEVLGEYACWDVILTQLLFEQLVPELKAQELDKLFYEEETMPLYREVTIPMNESGFPINVSHFEKLNEQISKDIDKLETKIIKAIDPLIATYVDKVLNEEFPVKPKGNFPKAYAEIMGFNLPKNKEGKPTLSKEAFKKLGPQKNAHHQAFVDWMLGTGEIKDFVVQTQLNMFWKKYPDQNYVFNLQSNNDLKVLFFEILQHEPLDTTDTGAPKVDDDFIQSLETTYAWIKDLIDYKKLNKLHSTYIQGMLNKQVDGVIYTSLIQFGTTSGRYASRYYNLQNLPRVKEEDSGLSELVLYYTNAIREGLVAPAGFKLVGADESALEPRCFSEMAAEQNLQQIFHNGADMYSTIAKDMFNLDGSVFKKDKDFIGKLYPEKRQLVKAFSLASVYGASAFRLAALMGVSAKEAQELLDLYFATYPNLKGYIEMCHEDAKTLGQVRTIFGRVRHLPRVKELYKRYGDRLLDNRWAKAHGLSKERSEFKNGLNNATNFPIQGLAAHVINRASINIMRAFKEQNVPARIICNIHDELICLAEESYAEKVRDIMKYHMETSVKLSVPFIAEPNIGDNLRESKG